MSSFSPVAPGRHSGRSRFFVATGAVFLLLVFAGFSATFYLKGFVTGPAGTPPPLLPYLIVHGVIMTAWYLLFLGQSVLVVSGRTGMHRQLGVAGLFLAAGVVVSGAFVSLGMPAHFLAPGGPAEFSVPLEVHQQVMPFLGIVIGNLVMLAVFSGMVAAAVLLRRRSAWHGRLMSWAFLLTLGPVFGGGGFRPLGPLLAPIFGLFPAWFPLVTAIFLIAMGAHDWIRMQRIHPATLVGAFVYWAAGALAGMVMSTEVAHTFYRSLAG